MLALVLALMLPSLVKTRLNIASVSSHIALKNRVSGFWHTRLLFFKTRIKLEERKNGITF